MMPKIFMITCREATLYISKKEEHKLPLAERTKLFLHLMICEFCKLFYKQSRYLTVEIKHLYTDSELSSKDKENLEQLIERASTPK